MNGIEALIRIFLFIVIFYYVVLDWALLPMLDPNIELFLTLEGYFFSTTPVGLTRTVMLASRGFLGLGLSLFVLIPAFRYLFEFEPHPWANTVLAAFTFLSIGTFFVSMFLYLYY